MSDLVLRHLELLKLIPRHAESGKTTRQLAEALDDLGFDISLRSVQRDLEKLSAAFPISCVADGKAHIWFYTLKEGQQLLIPAMDHQTALTLKLAQRHLKPLIPQQLKSFLDPYFPEAGKILKQHPSRLKKWLNKTSAISLGLQQLAPKIEDGVWDVISRAIIDEQQCEVVYRPQRLKRAKTYRISPLALVIRGPVTYLLAVYEGYEDIRQMAMHRFRSAKALVDDAWVPEGFDLTHYIQQGHFGILHQNHPVSLVLRVRPVLARILEEAPLSRDQIIEPLPDADDGAVRVCCTLPENWDLYRWLLSHGMDLKIEGPDHVRDTYLGYLEQSLGQYR